MAFDIYGNNLEPGYCEAHPWIAEEYPCSACVMEIQQNREYKKVQSQMAAEYYEEHMRLEKEKEELRDWEKRK